MHDAELIETEYYFYGIEYYSSHNTLQNFIYFVFQYIGVQSTLH